MTGPEQDPSQNPERIGGAEADPIRPSPRIYVASLSDYNAGHLHGEWIDATQELEDLEESVQAMLARSPTPGAEEYAIHDYEGFEPLHIDEYLPLSTVARLAAGIEEHGGAFAAWAHTLDSVHLGDYLDRFDDFYVGTFESATEFAEHELEAWNIDVGEIGPEPLRPYIRFDMEAYARDLSYEFRMVTDEEGQVHVFGVE
jgi:antirestriction protein